MDQALASYQQALAIREQRLGPVHPHTVDTRARYAHLAQSRGRSEEMSGVEEAPTPEQAPMRARER
jgi:hypothetical protein